MRRAAKKDNSDLGSNKVLQQLNIAYTDTSQLKNFCDKLVYYRGQTWHVEFKSKDYATKAQLEDPRLMLEDGERDHMNKLLDNGCRYIIAWDIWDMLEQIGISK